MTGVQRFANRIEQIKGVENYVVTRSDGHVVVHNLENSEKIASLVTIGDLHAQSIQKTLGFSDFGYMVFSRPQNQNLIIFSLDKYYLGILQKIDSNQTELIDEVSRFLFNLKNQKKTSKEEAH